MMNAESQLPDQFLQQLAELEASYLQRQDPIEQSGFGGGAARWRAEREPILDAITTDSDFLDVGCANGYLLECLVRWGRERGVLINPFGLDQGQHLVELARERQPTLADHFFVGNAWDWNPPRRFDAVYTLLDQVPLEFLPAYLWRLHDDLLTHGGRLVAGDYGSRSRGVPARDVAAIMQAAGFTIAGSAEGGNLGVARFAWVTREDRPLG